MEVGGGKEGGGETPLTPQPSNRSTFLAQLEETPADKYPLHYACREGNVDTVRDTSNPPSQQLTVFPTQPEETPSDRYPPNSLHNQMRHQLINILYTSPAGRGT